MRATVSVYNPSVSAHSDALCSLVESRLPVAVESEGNQDDWNVVGPAILVAAIRHLRALSELDNLKSRVISSQLLRSLYEYIATYAWIAAEPGSRIEQWLKYDFEYRLKMDSNFRELGDALITDEKRAWIEEQLPGVVAMPDLLARAKKADEAWTGTLDELDGLLPDELRSFQRLYPLIYRGGSQFTHPSSHVVDAFATRDGDYLVIGEEQESERDPVLIGTAVLAAGLAIAASAAPALGIAVDDLRQVLSS